MTQTLIFKQENRNNWETITTTLNQAVWKTKENYRKNLKSFKVEIKELKKEPSQNQRAYYFGVVLPAIRVAAANQEMHYKSVDELDQDIREVMKDEYSLYLEVKNNITGKMETRAISLSNMKGNKEMARKYIDMVIMWAEGYFLIEIPSYCR